MLGNQDKIKSLKARSQFHKRTWPRLRLVLTKSAVLTDFTKQQSLSFDSVFGSRFTPYFLIKILNWKHWQTTNIITISGWAVNGIMDPTGGNQIYYPLFSLKLYTRD